MRCKMMIYVASGGHLQTAYDMRAAICSGKAVTGCYLAVWKNRHVKPFDEES